MVPRVGGSSPSPPPPPPPNSPAAVMIFNHEDPMDCYWFSVEAVMTWEKLVRAVVSHFKPSYVNQRVIIYRGDVKIHPFEWQQVVAAGQTFGAIIQEWDA
ncbi:MAG: hypothetical protein M1835_005624 [Candelina submexicana]|nr:MAG: hypothetical protein M1835_005624 [Candelina submexicana]